MLLVTIVRSAPASLPPPASVRAKAPIFSARASGGTNRRFWPSVPNMPMNWVASDRWAAYMVLVAAHPRAISSMAMATWRMVPPLPPYSSSTPRPKRPSSASPRTLSHGKSPLWS